MRKIILGSAAAVALMVGGAGHTAAAPPEPEIFSLSCDNGRTFDVVVNGNGSFTPARSVDSTSVLIPIGFRDFQFRAVLPGGSVIEETSPEEDLKGGGNVSQRNPRQSVTCTFSQTFTLTEEDPDFGLPAGTVVTFSGTVSGYLTGR